MLVVYCVDIIRLNHFTIEICRFYCGACHCFYNTDVFLLCVFDHILECDILWMYLFLPYRVRKWHNKTVQSITLKYSALYKKKSVFLLTCTRHSLPKIHFRKATPEIPGWTMLYDFKGFFVIHVCSLYLAHYPFILETDIVKMGSHFALPVINKLCIFHHSSMNSNCNVC